EFQMSASIRFRAENLLRCTRSLCAMSGPEHVQQTCVQKETLFDHSSARAISEGGTVRPSAFAVLRLISSSNFVPCSTGRWLGLAARSTLTIQTGARVAAPKARKRNGEAERLCSFEVDQQLAKILPAIVRLPQASLDRRIEHVHCNSHRQS